MPTLHVRDIEERIDCCDVIATLKATSGVRTFGKTGKYVNLDLDDEGFAIKLTIFDEKSISMVENIQVNMFFESIFQKSQFQRNFSSTKLLCFLSFVFQVGNLVGNDFAVQQLDDGGLTAKQRDSINAKKDVARKVKFECPKLDCGDEMLKTDSGQYQCMKCNSGYSTFKFRDEKTNDPKNDDAAKTTPTKRTKADVVDEEQTPKKRNLRKQNKITHCLIFCQLDIQNIIDVFFSSPSLPQTVSFQKI